jgi:hypothetical protein
MIVLRPSSKVRKVAWPYLSQVRSIKAIVQWHLSLVGQVSLGELQEIRQTPSSAIHYKLGAFSRVN